MDNIEKKRTLQKGKVNLVDGLIYVFALIVIAALFLVGYYVIQNQSTAENENIESTGHLTYTVVFHNLNSEDVENIKALGEECLVTNPTNNKALGVLVGEPTIKTYEESERIDVVLNIKAVCTYVLGEGYFINGDGIRIGSSMNLVFNELEYRGYCMGLIFEDDQEVAQ